MISVITGDIIQSKKLVAEEWLTKLKHELNEIGSQPASWEIYRGDSFQVEIADPGQALKTAVKIKAAIKSIRKGDVRMSIGIGEKTHSATRITESNGSAFVYSGEAFEKLAKAKQNLAFASPFETFNRDMNLMLRLALVSMDAWTVNSAEMVHLALGHPEKSQAQLGDMLGIRQNAISNRLKRANFDEILDLLNWYKNRVEGLK
ncbi:transcriptional regulator [Maribellus sp. CM-23]|uniref:SatD family protein n=1 Tax=Maribellus sp. CM-23 TaxID=2781026 RepID=UPI001F23E0C5|nr:SatD family protein [Maribellus sp. CM-23]MCE4566833.1 transcriptional regulator [Maribellus sp. CM-23]